MSPRAKSSPFDRPRWSAEDAREVIAALERSGKAVREFATEHGLDPQRVYLWRRRLGEGAGPTTFQEVVVRPSTVNQVASATDGICFEVVMTTGHVIRVPQSFDRAALERLLDVVGRASGC